MIGEARHLPISWAVATLSAFIGTWSHVGIDSFMHADLQPFAPFSPINHLLGVISIEVLHGICIGSGVIGALVYFAIARRAGRSGNHAQRP